MPVHNTSMQIEDEGKNAEKDLETIKVETRLSSSHAFEEKIKAFCLKKLPTPPKYYPCS